MVIAGERRGHALRQVLERFKTSHGEIDVALSVVNGSLRLRHRRSMKKVAGCWVYREHLGKSARRRLQSGGLPYDGSRRRSQAKGGAAPIYSVDIETARLAGPIEGAQATLGVTIKSEDLLISATSSATGLRRGNQQRPPLILLGLTVVQA